MRLGYAGPPYIGCAHLYKDHPDFAGEVDHAALIAQLERDFDGWVLHASATATSMATLAPLVLPTGARWCTWVKGFAPVKPRLRVMLSLIQSRIGVVRLLTTGLRAALMMTGSQA